MWDEIQGTFSNAQGVSSPPSEKLEEGRGRGPDGAPAGSRRTDVKRARKMTRKVFGLASVVVAVGAAVIPATAQAVPHWYNNGSLVGSTPLTVKTRGILQSEPLPGLILSCKLKDTEEVWNPATGGPGADVVPTFTANCKPQCKHWELSLNTPRPSELAEAPAPGPILDVFTEVNIVTVSCEGKLIEEFRESPDPLEPEVVLGALNFTNTDLVGVKSGQNLNLMALDMFKFPYENLTAKNP
jgi:hypothetical protein